MKYWNRFMFHIEGETKDWVNRHIDLAIIDLVLSKVIDDYSSNIVPWRFHRRYKRGEHHFRFYVFSSEGTASAIKSDIDRNPFLGELSDSRYLKKSLWEEEGEDREDCKTGIGDYSDPVASEIRRVWPYYAQGFSESLRRLIWELRGCGADDVEKLDLETKLGIYKRVDSRIEELWFKSGAHTFFHQVHLAFGWFPTRCAMVFNELSKVNEHRICDLIDIRGLGA